ncbi:MULTISPECIES: hypothetical protein [spotted fever group]|uniref:Uncharacterized protein n=1 Tax=Rickettsia tamurae subsp. buchneri TaxID=1462938 RepID=A0A8E0WLL1_9RICK|nr:MULTISPECIES: hypothetical protein [spotted fever group]KDO02814.1 hypothetical protein REISMN_05005 [Rickettsia tamurae subsp. buchneri]
MIVLKNPTVLKYLCHEGVKYGYTLVVASFRFKIKHQIRKDTSNFTYFFDAVYHVLQKVTTLSA